MDITIPDDLNRRLEQLAKGTGQNVSALVCEAIEQSLALEEGKKPPRKPLLGRLFLPRIRSCP